MFCCLIVVVFCFCFGCCIRFNYSQHLLHFTFFKLTKTLHFELFLAIGLLAAFIFYAIDLVFMILSISHTPFTVCFIKCFCGAQAMFSNKFFVHIDHKHSSTIWLNVFLICVSIELVYATPFLFLSLRPVVESFLELCDWVL